MPTHKDLPDLHEDEPDWDLDRARSDHRPWAMMNATAPAHRRRTRVPMLFVLVLFALAYLISRFAPEFTTAPSPAVPVLPKASSGSLANQETQTAPSAGSRGKSVRLLARGFSLPGAGLPPKLVAVTGPGHVVVRSLSPAPVAVALSDGYGHPMRDWATLRNGEVRSESIVTGRPYGYCFSQPASRGFAATRGCGTLIVHEHLNGTKLPDGAVTVTNVSISN